MCLKLFNETSSLKRNGSLSGCSLSIRDGRGFTPLAAAASAGLSNSVKIFLSSPRIAGNQRLFVL